MEPFFVTCTGPARQDDEATAIERWENEGGEIPNLTRRAGLSASE
jgi:hypothetical protein